MPDAGVVVVVGGGAVGATLALALVAAGWRCMVIEPRMPREEAPPLRPIALAHGSRLILERAGVWARIQPVTPIERIHVSQRAGFGRATLAAHDLGLAALGYVVDHARVQAAFDEALAGLGECVVRARVTKITPGQETAAVEYVGGAESVPLQARLVVIADGGALPDEQPARMVDYRQSAVVASVATARPHQNTAFERFSATGPIGLLPYGERCALVWSVPPERARELCDASESLFATALQRDFGVRLGRFSHITDRGAFPLVLKVFTERATPRMLRIGNASQMLHPVAGQGLNVGLRDAWELAELILAAGESDPGRDAVLRAYRTRRRNDRAGSIWLTHALVRTFSNELLPLKAARALGLTALGCIPPARNLLARRMTFGKR